MNLFIVFLSSLLLSALTPFALAQTSEAVALENKILAEKALAAIGASVANSSNKCAGCHQLDALTLRRWVDTTAKVKNECLTHWETGRTKSSAEGALRCISGNANSGFPWSARHLGLWAGRVQTADFDEVFETFFESSAKDELDHFRQSTYMPRSGGPGFSDENWAMISEWILRGAPLLEETLLSQNIEPRNPATPVKVTESVLLSDLRNPWAVVTSPDNEIWITEKGGNLKIYSSSYVLQKTLTGFPDFHPRGQGGLLDIAFHPRFKENGWVYFTYTVERSGGYNTRINRFTYRNGNLEEHKVILDGPSGTDGAHFGSRMVFGRDDLLYATFGERHQPEKAQKLNSLHGKTVRVTDEGMIPADNPFGDDNPIFTLGHRNPQGIAMHPVSGRLFTAEHGPTGYDAPGGGDEVNILKPGANYGWPVIHHNLTQVGMESPLKEYTPAIAPSGVSFYTGNLIPQWKNDFFMAALRGARLVRLRIDENGIVREQENLLTSRYGRIRDVGNAPDGSLLVVTDNGQLVQLK